VRPELEHAALAEEPGHRVARVRADARSEHDAMASLDRRDRVELDTGKHADRLLDLAVAAATGTSCIALRADDEPSQGGRRDRAHVPQPIEARPGHRSAVPGRAMS